MVTAAGLGIFESIEAAIAGMVRVKQVFVPDPARVEIYTKIYARVYQRMFRALNPLYREIQAITGYPEQD
jgi:sugar (pentulose or hexulose) kinase